MNICSNSSSNTNKKEGKNSNSCNKKICNNNCNFYFLSVNPAKSNKSFAMRCGGFVFALLVIVSFFAPNPATLQKRQKMKTKQKK